MGAASGEEFQPQNSQIEDHRGLPVDDQRQASSHPFETVDPRHHCPQFTCPKCGSHRLEEVLTDCTVSSEILDMGPGGDLEYGEANNDGGCVDRYQCLNCGCIVPNAEDAEALAVALGVDPEDSRE